MISKNDGQDKDKEQNKEQCQDCLALKEKIIVLEKDLKESNDKYLYLLADFDNYKKHLQKVFDETKETANEKLLFELLTFADDFDRAFETIKDEESKSSTYTSEALTSVSHSDAQKGVLIIKENFAKLLNDFGVKKIDAIGKIADPKFHEILLTEKSDRDKGTILEELQKGYTYKNKILRHAKVRISEWGDWKWQKKK